MRKILLASMCSLSMAAITLGSAQAQTPTTPAPAPMQNTQPAPMTTTGQGMGSHHMAKNEMKSRTHKKHVEHKTAPMKKEMMEK